MGDAAQARDEFRFQVELEQAEHLRVAVLLNHINALVLLDEFVDFASERISTQTKIVGFDTVLVAKLVAAFDDAPMRRSVGDDSDFRVCAFLNFWARYEGAG